MSWEEEEEGARQIDPILEDDPPNLKVEVTLYNGGDCVYHWSQYYINLRAIEAALGRVCNHDFESFIMEAVGE